MEQYYKLNPTTLCGVYCVYPWDRPHLLETTSTVLYGTKGGIKRTLLSLKPETYETSVGVVRDLVQTEEKYDKYW